MRIFDLSQPLFDGCPNCPVHPPISLPRTADHPTEGWRMEEFRMASHSGTHLDAPLHKIAGADSIDTFPLEQFTGRPLVADLSAVAQPDMAIGADVLAQALNGEAVDSTAVILLNTGWGLRRAATAEWWHHSPWLNTEGAAWLAERRVRGVGIDHFSIGGTQPEANARTHEILLAAGIWIVEELCFRHGWQDAAENALFQALPLLLPGFSGSPCRAVLIQS